MRHAVLGAGGVGLLAAALARAGAEVLLLLRPDALAAYPGRIVLESVVLGDGTVDVPAAAALDRDVDALWIATKAPQLEAALALAPPAAVGDAVVVPLLNGVEHVALLRARYRHVVAAAIRVGSERVAPGVIRQRSPFLRVDLAGAPALAAELSRAGIACASRDDETTVLWDKLAMLAPLALATAASGEPLGGVRDDPRYAASEAEVVAVAQAEGARIDAAAVAAFRADGPAEMRSSLQLDVERGGPTELDAVAGAVRRAAARHRDAGDRRPRGRRRGTPRAPLTRSGVRAGRQPGSRSPREPRDDEVVAVLDQVEDHRVRQAAVDDHRVPVALRQVVARRDRVVAPAQLHREVGLALEADPQRRIRERREREHLRGHLEHGRVLAERVLLARAGPREAGAAEVVRAEQRP